jgi:hypothetical protein
MPMLQHKFKLGATALAIAALSFTAGTLAQGRFPEINRAEGHLQGALADLRLARDIFGGHKVAAEHLIEQALAELQQAKGFAH